MSESRDLALIDKASAMLAEAETIYDAKCIHDLAELAEHRARQVKSQDLEQRAKVYRLRAERLLGEFTAQMEKHPTGGGRPSKTRAAEAPVSKLATLEEVGIRKEQAARFERIAAIPEKRFEEEVRKPEVTTRALARIGSEYRPRQERRRPRPVPVTRPPVSERSVEQRLRMFRSELERVVQKHLARWPAGTPTAPLANVLIEISNNLKEPD